MTINDQILAYLKNMTKRSITIEDLAHQMGQFKASDYKAFIKLLNQMERDKLLSFSRAGKVMVYQPKPQVEGLFRANANGFGFVVVADNGDEPDLFIGRGKTGFAMDGDEVLVEIDKPANRMKGTAAEGRIIEIKARAITRLVGTFVQFDEIKQEDSGLIGFITSKNKKIPYKIYIGQKGLRPANGDVVKVDITHYPEKGFEDAMQGIVIEVIGNSKDIGIDVLEVLESFDIVSTFPQAVIDQANQVPEEVDDQDLMGRVDYRNEITYTIDSESAKDLDDAIHVKQLPNGNYELGVHIADVSHYVTEDSPLDKEALERGTSVYVVDRVVPMLPERLSNGICSLNPRVNRFTQSCVMEINAQGKVVDYQISQSIIKTTERMTYTDVNHMIAGSSEHLARFDAIAESVEHAKKLHDILEGMRHARGAIDFETKEAKIIVNKQGVPVDIVSRDRGIAERMIESFMLAANETVAYHFDHHDLPFIYRIHEHPKAEKLANFIDFASVFGIPLKGTAQKMAQHDLQAFMDKVKGQPGEVVLSTMLLRSMQQAKYSEKNIGHYGLAATDYTHFTSPIRRYPDLLVHRLIRELAQGASTDKKSHFEALIPDVAAQSSQRERRAIDAERQVEAMKKAEYMAEYVGQEFDAMISSVVKFGMFVGLPNTIEGLVHISTLGGEFYNFNERNLTLQGESSGITFKMGHPIKVKLIKADKNTGDIDFEYVPSSFDLRERVDKSSETKRAKPRHNEQRGGKRPFYKKVAKDAQNKG